MSILAPHASIPLTVTVTLGRSSVIIDPSYFDEVEIDDPEHLRAALKSTVAVAIDDAVDDWFKRRRNPHMPRHPRPRGPRGGTSEAQSILLPEDEFTAAQAKAWVKRHGFKVSGYEAPGERGAYHRFRQFDPDRRHSYRTIPFGDSGVMAVVEVPKRK